MAQQYANSQPAGYKNFVEKIAIVGAGGRIGKYITESLLKTGKHTVTAITREDSTSDLPAGVLSKKVNYSNQESLVEALRDQDVLIITMNVMAPPDTQTKLIDAAATAGVPWVLPNEFGGDPLDKAISRDSLVGDMKAKFRNQIEQLGKSSWICVTCSFWYEFSLGGGPNRYGFDFKNRSLVLLDNGKTRINTSTMPSVGRGVAALLSLKVLPDNEGDKSPTLISFKNKALYISSFTINQEEMFESILRMTGEKRSDWTISHTTAKEYFESGQELMKQGNMAGFCRLLYARAFFPESNVNYGAVRGLHNNLLGLPQDDLDTFTKEAAEIWSQETY